MCISYKGENLKAEECFKRSLGIYQRKYGGRNHPTIATAMNNLGLVNKKKGNFVEAGKISIRNHL